MLAERIDRRWEGQTVVVAGTGMSLPVDAGERCKGFRQIAVNDAYLRLPDADVLYAADEKWWEYHNGVLYFTGERWSCDGPTKLSCAGRYGIYLVHGEDVGGFSTDQTKIHFGGNSGFQAVNLAILFGAAKIVLIGFDMSGSHFFGKHPYPLLNADPTRFIKAFELAARSCPVKIINCTPRSALKCFPMLPLEVALE